MSDNQAICPCAGFEHPATITNPPGLDQVAYRIGDFHSVRRALLTRRPNEQALAALQLNGPADLVLQMLEWWAYLAEILTVYEERSLNESLLRTAQLEGSVRALIRILGYRPRPGIAGSAKLGALLSGPRPVLLPAGFAIDSKPPPGQPAKRFETTVATALSVPDAVAAQPPTGLGAHPGLLYLVGTISDLRPGEFLILQAPGQDLANASLLQVASSRSAKDAAGTPLTEIALAGSPTLASGPAAGFTVLRSRRAIGLWKYSTAINLVSSPIDVEAVERDLKAGDAFVLTAPGTALPPSLRVVAATSEQVWYANGDASSPPAAPTVPIGLPHSRLGYNASGLSTSQWDAVRNQVRILVDWQPGPAVRDAPVAGFDGTQSHLDAIAPARFRVGASQTVLIEDADGNGVVATAAVAAATPGRLDLVGYPGLVPPFPQPLKAPLRVLQNVIEVREGKSVPVEVLGSGDGTLAGQSFTLKKAPLTYLPAGAGYASTLTVRVNGVAWTEVANFLDQPADAQIYVTAEDDQQKTTVWFGDGVNGARLPTGTDNIIARYQVGSGAAVSAAATLTNIAKPWPGVRAVRHPVAGGGGSDPDPAGQISRTAPQSVLSFGRAISADDYEVIAGRASGVVRVRAVYGWNAEQQRATVMIYAGDTPAAVDSARAALTLAADPNRPVTVVPAQPVGLYLAVEVQIEPGRVAGEVKAAVVAALTDPATGLLGRDRVRIGAGVYFSQIAAACLSVPGVNSMPVALVLLLRPDPVTGRSWVAAGSQPKLAVGNGEFFQLDPNHLFVFTEDLTSV